MDGLFLGVDLGSVSTNLVLIDNKDNVIEKLYLRTEGRPIKVLQKGFDILKDKIPNNIPILSAGCTGSGRQLASAIVGADIVKNEITAHGVAALNLVKDVNTIIEIGGQDSKIITISNSVITDFAMNTVCAAGTGSFLDRQASRLNVSIEKFGEIALKSKTPVRIAGRCAVFAESDMIHKQQLGHNEEDIINGLCHALVRNYLNNVAKGKTIKPPIIFQGGVAANVGIKRAFEEQLGFDVFVPKHYEVMGAIGVAILAKEKYTKQKKSSFKGLSIINNKFNVNSFQCNGCSNNCEVIELISNESIFARWGDRCGKWSSLKVKSNKMNAV
ncbi:MAG: acyl-CoA dehydratase activase [Clostridia bacterium]|nr:acyl-CoA dehydratase activase [Clostridia bacterium]